MIKASIQWMFLIIGTTIGAGYASGRELWEFFGHESELAIITFTILFSVSCYTIMLVSYHQQAKDYSTVLQEVVGNRFLPVLDLLLFMYLFMVTIVMIAGSGATGSTFNLSYGWGIIFIAISLIVLFISGTKGVIKLNQFIVPVLLLGLIVVLLLFIRKQNISFVFHWTEQNNWFSAFPFTALNILPLTAVLGAIGYQIRTKAEIYIACIGSGLILGAISFIYNRSLIQVEDILKAYEIPLYALLENSSLIIIVMMTILLWFAIYTTAASGMLGIISRIQTFMRMPSWQIVIILLTIMIPFALFGFAVLIKYAYPIFGILNLYILYKLLTYTFWN